MSTSKESPITFEDYLRFRELAFEWADSYDCKDWDRLRAIAAPVVQIDYTEVNGNDYRDVSADNFVAFAAHPGFLGDELIDTQHLLGAMKVRSISHYEVVASIQIRAAHQRYTDKTKTVVEAKGHGHAMIELTYSRQNGETWMLAGLRPSVRWNEFSFDKIFTSFDPQAVLTPTTQRLDLITGSAGDVVHSENKSVRDAISSDFVMGPA